MSPVQTPLVSIIIPCYNAEKWIGDAIRSAVAQTYTRKEIIVIDDGSSDASFDIMSGFGRAVHCERGEHRGGCSARNRGLELAQGAYVQFLDADDLLHKDKIKLQIQALSTLPPDSIATCPWNHFTTEAGHSPLDVRPFWISYDVSVNLLIDMWLDGGFYTPHCWLVPREVVARAGKWNESLTADQDGEFFARVLLQASSVSFVDGARAYYRTPGKSNVSATLGQAAVGSRLRAWESAQAQLLARRPDSIARRAVLRRLRAVTYSYARNDRDFVEWASQYEAQLAVRDFDPHLPVLTRFLVGIFGIRRGLMLRAWFLPLRRRCAWLSPLR